MNSPGRYDTSLQMFIEKSRDADLEQLRFLRWLAERGKLEHRPYGPARGSYAIGAGRTPTEEWPLAS